jgi:hypothetical protein
VERAFYSLLLLGSVRLGAMAVLLNWLPEEWPEGILRVNPADSGSAPYNLYTTPLGLEVQFLWMVAWTEGRKRRAGGTKVAGTRD